MQDKEDVYLPISFEYLMSHLFGKEKYHGYTGRRPKGPWKKDLKRIVKYLKKSIYLNAVSDQHHKNELIARCEKLEKDIEKSTATIEKINVAVIENLFKLSFQLLGNLPDHMEAKAPWSDKCWKLDGYRSLNYCQSDEQKTNLLLKIDATKKYPDDAGQDRTLRQILGCRFKDNHSEFLSWFKSEYPEEYCRIF